MQSVAVIPPSAILHKEQLDNKNQQSGNKFSSQIISQHSLIIGILGLPKCP